jgi:hypothetical protein
MVKAFSEGLRDRSFENTSKLLCEFRHHASQHYTDVFSVPLDQTSLILHERRKREITFSYSEFVSCFEIFLTRVKCAHKVFLFLRSDCGGRLQVQKIKTAI